MSYARISEALWTSRGFQGLSDDGRLLELYVKSCPHRNRLGCFRLDPHYVVADVGWEVERVKITLNELVSASRIMWDAEARVVLDLDALRVDPLQNGNVVKGAIRELDSVPDTELIAYLLQALESMDVSGWKDDAQHAHGRLLDAIQERLPNGSETVSGPSRTPSLSQPVSQPVTHPAPTHARLEGKEALEGGWLRCRDVILKRWHRGREHIDLDSTSVGMGLEKTLFRELAERRDIDELVGAISVAPDVFQFERPTSLRWFTSDKHGSANYEQAVGEWHKREIGPPSQARSGGGVGLQQVSV